MSHSKMPRVPPAARSPKAVGGADRANQNGAAEDTSKRNEPPKNLAEQGRQGNINQNTHHQGHQQDR